MTPTKRIAVSNSPAARINGFIKTLCRRFGLGGHAVLQKLYHKVSDSPKPINQNLPNHFVDVADTLEIQQRALALHRSQTGVRDAAARAFIENTARTNGKHLGVEYAEAFRRIVIEGALVIAEGTKL